MLDGALAQLAGDFRLSCRYLSRGPAVTRYATALSL